MPNIKNYRSMYLYKNKEEHEANKVHINKVSELTGYSPKVISEILKASLAVTIDDLAKEASKIPTNGILRKVEERKKQDIRAYIPFLGDIVSHYKSDTNYVFHIRPSVASFNKLKRAHIQCKSCIRDIVRYQFDKKFFHRSQFFNSKTIDQRTKIDMLDIFDQIDYTEEEVFRI